MAYRPLNVLLVDDDEGSALLFRLVAEWEQAQLRLEVVDSGQKALDYLAGKTPYSDRTTYPFPDIVALDLVMPGITGFDILDWRQSYPEFKAIPVVVFSGSLRETDKEKALAKGATRFVIKPVDLPQLRTTIAEILEVAAQSFPPK